MEIHNETQNRDAILIKCKQAIETLTNEIEKQKQVNFDM